PNLMRGRGTMRLRALFVSAAAAGLMVAPAFANGITGSVAGARTECTIVGTTKDDVICGKAGSDSVDALEGNDVVRGGQGDDGGGCFPAGPIIRGCNRGLIRGAVTHGFITDGLNGGDGSDVVKG